MDHQGGEEVEQPSPNQGFGKGKQPDGAVGHAQYSAIAGSGLTQKTRVVFKITNDFKELMDWRHF